MLYNHAKNNAEATTRTILTLEKFYGVNYLGILAGIADKFRAKIEAEFTQAERAEFAALDYCKLIE